MASFAAGLLNATVQAAMVLLLAGFGGLISERAGALNLGVERMMLVGVLGGFVVTAVMGNYWLGFGVGITCGMALAAVHVFLCTPLKSNQAISGVMLTLLGIGLTTFFGPGWVQKSITGFLQMTFSIVGRYLVHLPLVGEAFFRGTATDHLALLAMPVVWFLLRRSNLGFEIIVVGEDPEMADTMGVPMFKFRYLAVTIGGGSAGAAGACLSLAFSQLWVPGMIVSRGWIAVALIVFVQWQPSRVLVGAYPFGLLDAPQLRPQSLPLALDPNAPLVGVLNPFASTLMSPRIMSTYPHLTTITALSYAVIRTESARLAVSFALSQSYNREMD